MTYQVFHFPIMCWEMRPEAGWLLNMFCWLVWRHDFSCDEDTLWRHNVLDIDVVPNVHLRHQFLDFARRNSLFKRDVNDKMAYVLPVFEVKAGKKFPGNKKELLEGVGYTAADNQKF